LDQGWEIGTLLQRSLERADRTAPFNEVKPYVNRLMAGWRHIYEPTQGPSSGIKESLSPRERNIIELIAAGQTNKEIARSLGITPETVKTHLKNIFVRFSVTKRSQAVARAQSLGLVKT
jgi:LuxR family maltose regulon positive regulatory protein